MNKKLIIGIIAGVVAVAVLVVGIIFAVGKISSNGGTADDDSSKPTSSATDSTSSQADSLEKSEPKAVESKAGSIVEVPIMITKNPGIYLCRTVFKYDPNVLTYVDCVEGDVFDESYFNDAGNGKLIGTLEASELADTTETGTLVTLRFEISKDAKAGEYTVEITDESQFGSLEEEFVKPTVCDGIVTVK